MIDEVQSKQRPSSQRCIVEDEGFTRLLAYVKVSRQFPWYLVRFVVILPETMNVHSCVCNLLLWQIQKWEIKMSWLLLILCCWKVILFCFVYLCVLSLSKWRLADTDQFYNRAQGLNNTNKLLLTSLLPRARVWMYQNIGSLLVCRK